MSLGDCWKQLSWFYYQYLLVTALYMLEPWERTVFTGPAEETQLFKQQMSILRGLELTPFVKGVNMSVADGPVGGRVFSLTPPPPDSLLISVAGMAVYTGYVFMPQHIMAILHYFEVVQ
ncbi:Serine palmitoyltransferase small subunit A [Liparis tanakae]|uniref:Serine palmitoyltransferase small subunit A n=1 Tax=Liparis tanakae TaxID=230148 RepID=A0A4Z2FLF3_9TELE|nr:Serine palmitoyltransferase small subunit A [Liparis tanakae]